MILGFVNGADCLEYMNKYFEDQGFIDANDGNSFHANTLGRFLASIERSHWRQFQDVIILLALKMRLKLFPDDRDFILDVDSTIHEQHGRKMEGCGYNINVWGYQSLQAYHIKELKNGYDIHHFPCMKLVANQMYGVFAYNLSRFGAWMWDKEKLRLAKNVRFRLVHIPALVGKRAGKRIYYLSKHQRKEMTTWMTNIRCSFGYG